MSYHTLSPYSFVLSTIFFFGNGFDLCRPSIGKLTRRNDKEKIGKFIADNVTMSLDVRAYDSR